MMLNENDNKRVIDNKRSNPASVWDFIYPIQTLLRCLRSDGSARSRKRAGSIPASADLEGLERPFEGTHPGYCNIPKKKA